MIDCKLAWTMPIPGAAANDKDAAKRVAIKYADDVSITIEQIAPSDKWQPLECVYPYDLSKMYEVIVTICEQYGVTFPDGCYYSFWNKFEEDMHKPIDLRFVVWPRNKHLQWYSVPLIPDTAKPSEVETIDEAAEE